MTTTRLANFAAQRPWRVVLGWVLALVVFGALQGVFPLNSTTDVTLLNNPESVQGWDLLIEHGIREERQGSETIVVQSETVQVSDPTFQAAVQNITDTLRADTASVASVTNYYEVNAQSPEAAAGMVSDDGLTTFIPVTLAGDLEFATENADVFIETYEEAKLGAEGFLVLSVGDATLNEDINTITEEDIAKGETIGAVIAFIILVFVFAAVVAAFVPIIVAILSIGIAFGLSAIFSQFFELSLFVTSMITMIGLAVGIDYSLFVVERYREERRHGYSKLDSIGIAGSTASRAVLFSGITVIVALAGMIIVPNNIYRSLAIGAIFVVIVAVAASLTLLPAVISLLGDKLDWPMKRNYDEAQARPREEDMHNGFWGKLTRVVMARPIISLVLSVGFLLVCAIPYLSFEPGLGFITSLPDELEGKQAYLILQEEFSAGLISPVEIVIDGSLDDPAVQAGITQLQADIATAVREDGQPLFGPSSVTESEDRLLGLITVPMTVAPDEPEGIDAVIVLRESIIPPVEVEMNGAEVLVTGVTANNLDFLEMRDTYTPIVFIFVLGLSFILLLLVFRSIVIAIKAIIMNLLSVGAAYGLLVWVFQEGHLTGLFGFQQVSSIEAWLPLFLFSILFGLSMDYHVFLLSRIKEHYDHSHRNAESVAVGLQSTARIITGAALIMVAVFAGFASGRLVFLQQMGFGLGVAVLLDATIVRSILVPAAMALLGDRNWYLPKWLNWLPDLRVEGPAIEPPVPTGTPAD